MKVREIMSREIESCAPGTNLAAAAELVWKRDCGALPVVDEGRLAGMITDRDMFIALGTRDRRASEVLVRDVVSDLPVTCNGEDDVATALRIMRAARVRRLPVVNAAGTLEGIVSLSDIALHAVSKGRSVSHEEVVNTVKSICEQVARMPVTAETGKPAALAVAG